MRHFPLFPFILWIILAVGFAIALRLTDFLTAWMMFGMPCYFVSGALGILLLHEFETWREERKDRMTFEQHSKK